MRIQAALPPARYAKAAAHAKTPEFIQKRDQAIHLVREWAKSKIINHKYPHAVMFSYGKDSSAVCLLLKMAGIEFVTLTIHNGGDLPFHYAFYPEWDTWFGDVKERIVHKTNYRYIDYKYELVRWGQINGVTKKNGSPVDFFDLGPLTDSLEWYILRRFENVWAQDAEDVLISWGDRASEAMYKFYQIKSSGLLSRWGGGKNQVPYFQGEPIGWWKDLDVWALLVSEDAPVSPVYSMHEIPQRSGRAAFPQTLWYPSPNHMSSVYYKWMARYAPLQLKEMLQLFPEIPAVLKRKQKEAKSKKDAS